VCTYHPQTHKTGASTHDDEGGAGRHPQMRSLPGLSGRVACRREAADSPQRCPHEIQARAQDSSAADRAQARGSATWSVKKAEGNARTTERCRESYGGEPLGRSSTPDAGSIPDPVALGTRRPPQTGSTQDAEGLRAATVRVRAPPRDTQETPRQQRAWARSGAWPPRAQTERREISRPFDEDHAG
jgi:hypothetical protein